MSRKALESLAGHVEAPESTDLVSQLLYSGRSAIGATMRWRVKVQLAQGATQLRLSGSVLNLY
eukprot:6437455-Alexandrium_andersonii.AAC.1